MSNIYHTEPPTKGRVLLKTSQGDIDIELWPKEAPLACRNFIQLCLEGYYDNCPIHRIIKDFMIQMGDPSGSGTGGESIWGRPFKDEIHGRIKFNHRGQVAMANENKPNSNHSQFFITLGSCEWIDRKHTIFGKVTGNTIYNVIRMGEVEVDSTDRPVDKIYIISTEVLWNPFDDIVPRFFFSSYKFWCYQ
jgi:peptidyl-prolyl cis-trans isomerase SDCCAG10